jgi:hypothetical protein
MTIEDLARGWVSLRRDELDRALKIVDAIERIEEPADGESFTIPKFTGSME